MYVCSRERFGNVSATERTVKIATSSHAGGSVVRSVSVMISRSSPEGSPSEATSGPADASDVVTGGR